MASLYSPYYLAAWTELINNGFTSNEVDAIKSAVAANDINTIYNIQTYTSKTSNPEKIIQAGQIL